MQKYNGKVINLKKKKTATIEVISLKLHSKYHKQIKIRRKIHAHNDKLQLKEGDEVKIISSPPFSKTKKFMVVSKKTK